MEETMKTNNIQPIVGYGSPILREVCLEVENSIDKVKLLNNDLILTLESIGTAVGLAAPQVNINLRMFVMSPNRRPIIVINPIITKRRGARKSEEGCLSLMGIYGIVERDEIIDVEFYDVDFNKHKLRLRGFDATIFLHELDHLNGILYTDRLTKDGKEAVKDKLSDIEKGIYKKVSYDVIFPKTDIKTVTTLP